MNDVRASECESKWMGDPVFLMLSEDDVPLAPPSTPDLFSFFFLLLSQVGLGERNMRKIEEPQSQFMENGMENGKG